MKTINKIIAIFFTLLLCINTFVLSLANEQATVDNENEIVEISEPSETAQDKMPVVEFTQPDDASVIATVNGIEIKGKIVNDLFFQIIDQYSRYGVDVNNFDMQQEVYKIAIDSSVQREVIMQKANELKLNVFSDDEINSFTKMAEEMYNGALQQIIQEDGLKDDATEAEKQTAEEKAKSTLIEYGYTVKAIVENEKLKAILGKLEEYLTKDIEISDEDINNKYNELVEKGKLEFENNVEAYENALSMGSEGTWFVPKGYKGIKHILLNINADLLNKYMDLSAKFEEISKEHTEDTQSDESQNGENATKEDEKVTKEDIDLVEKEIIASVQATVDEINKQIAEGASFISLIEKYGNDPGMNVEPYKTEGYRVNNSSIMYDPAFTNAASKLEKIGDISEPVIGMYGVHILYYNSDIKDGAVDLNETSKETIRNILLKEKKDKIITETIDSWKNEATVVINE